MLSRVFRPLLSVCLVILLLSFVLTFPNSTRPGSATDSEVTLVKNFGFVSAPKSLTPAGNTLFFIIDDWVHGEELWKSDGTESGTKLVKDINIGSEGSHIVDLTAVNDTVFFLAYDGVHGQELWKSDGTEAGTILVKDNSPGPLPEAWDVNRSDLNRRDILVNRDGLIYFMGCDGSVGYGLWQSDGTEAGTISVKALYPSSSACKGFGFTDRLTDVNGTLFFLGNQTALGRARELWKSDGTADGTVLVKAPWSVTEYLTNVNGTLFFTCSVQHDTWFHQLWTSDGTEAGTVLIRDMEAHLAHLTPVNDRLFFSIQGQISLDPAMGGLWVSDGTPQGTIQLVQDTTVPEMIAVNGILYFKTGSYELWRSDGTRAGTALVIKDSVVEELTNVNGTLFFKGTADRVRSGLWKSDGTADGTTQVTALTGSQLTNVSGTLFFLHGSYELWKTNRTIPAPPTPTPPTPTPPTPTPPLPSPTPTPKPEPFDLSIQSVEPVQVIEGVDLVQNKATAVKIVVEKTGAGWVNKVPVTLTYDSTSYTSFYVAEESNLIDNVLREPNSQYSLNFRTEETTKTIYFFGSGLAPTGSTWQATATVDPEERIVETNEANNSRVSDTAHVISTRWGWVDPSLWTDQYLNIAYLPADWPNHAALRTFDQFYRASGTFIEGVFPVASQNMITTKHLFPLSSAKYRSSDGQMSRLGMIQWIHALWLTLRLSDYGDYATDRFVIGVPSGWFKTTYIGNSGLGLSKPRQVPIIPIVISEVITPTQVNGLWVTIPVHEIGHTFGLHVYCEEYDSNCDGEQDRTGEESAPGLWVQQRKIVQSTPTHPVYGFMSSAEGKEYWVDKQDYQSLLSLTRSTAAVSAATLGSPVLLVSGTFVNSSTVNLNSWYTLPAGHPDPLPTGPYSFEYQDAQGVMLNEYFFDISFTWDGEVLPVAPFVYTIPYIANTSRIIIKHNNIPIAQKIVSTHAPVVNIVAPDSGERLSGTTTIHWNGSDADGDPLSYAVFISPDDGQTWSPLAMDITETSYVWDLAGVPPGAQYRVRVLATDGVNTGQDLSDSPFTVLGKTYLPLLRQ